MLPEFLQGVSLTDFRVSVGVPEWAKKEFDRRKVLQDAEINAIRNCSSISETTKEILIWIIQH